MKQPRPLVLAALATLTLGGASLAAAAGPTETAPRDERRGGQWIQLADVESDFTLDEERMSVADDEAVRPADVGFDLAERGATAPSCHGSSALFTWTIQDYCGDGRGLYVRFFDVTNNLVWPNATQAYVIGSGRSSTLKLTAKRGAKICYGAEPNPQNGYYWGLSIDGDLGCSNCCNVVPSTGNISRTVKLYC